MPYSPMELAEAFVRTGELTDALDALNQQLESNSADDSARRLRAQVLTRLPGDENLQAALHDLEQISSPVMEDNLLRAILLEQVGDYVQAVTVIQTIHQSHPHDEQIAERYFWLLMRARDYDEARTLISRMPHSWDWLSRAGDLATEDGHEADAPGYYTEALQLLAIQFDLSVDSFARPIQTNLLLARGQANATLNQFQEADADYAAARELMPDDLMISFWHSFVLLELNREDEAVALCRFALNGANPTLREMMVGQLQILKSNPTFAAIATLIEG